MLNPVWSLWQIFLDRFYMVDTGPWHHESLPCVWVRILWETLTQCDLVQHTIGVWYCTVFFLVTGVPQELIGAKYCIYKLIWTAYASQTCYIYIVFTVKDKIFNDMQCPSITLSLLPQTFYHPAKCVFFLTIEWKRGGRRGLPGPPSYNLFPSLICTFISVRLKDTWTVCWWP